MRRTLPITLVHKLFHVSTVHSALAEGCKRAFLSSQSHRIVDFSIQKTQMHVSWNKPHSFSVCFPLSTALLDKTHLAVSVGFAGSVAGPWNTGWAGPALCFQPQIPLHPQSPVMIWFAFPPKLSLHLKLATQPHSLDKARRANTAHHQGTGGYSILLRSACLFLGKDACEMSPHHPTGTARERLSHQQQRGPCSATSTRAADDPGRRAEEVHEWGECQHQRGDRGKFSIALVSPEPPRGDFCPPGQGCRMLGAA